MIDFWVPNRSRPSMWCRLFHVSFWWSNDWGTWWTSGCSSFEVRCTRCSACWSQEATHG